MIENRAGDFGIRMISRNGVFSSSPVDIAELAVERRGVSALTRDRTDLGNSAIRERTCPMTSR